MSQAATSKNYALRHKSQAFIKGCFRGFSPLLEVAREGLSGRYALTEREGRRYGRRISMSHLDLCNPSRADIEYVVRNFTGFPPEVQKEAIRHLSVNMGRLDHIVLGVFCGFPGGSVSSYLAWEKTRAGVRNLVEENAHLLR